MTHEPRPPCLPDNPMLAYDRQQDDFTVQRECMASRHGTHSFAEHMMMMKTYQRF